MSIVISSESTADLSKDLLEKYNIHVVPFSVILGDDSRLDGQTITNEDIYNYVKTSNQLPKTSAVNQFQYEEHFKKLLETYDEVIHICFSSELSSACRNAMLASEAFNGKVHIIDSLSLSSGIATLLLYAKELVDQNKSSTEIVDLVKKRIPFVQCSFVISNVQYLYKGGRCSKIAFLGANIFHICPQIIMANGKMDSGKKYRGKYSSVVNQYVDDTLLQFNHPDLNHVFLTHTLTENKDEILNAVMEKLKSKGFKNIHIQIAGSTITSHCGPNCLGILYINDKE